MEGMGSVPEKRAAHLPMRANASMNFRRTPLLRKLGTVGKSEACSDAARGDAVYVDHGDDGTQPQGVLPVL
jgi:hypothetical protein